MLKEELIQQLDDVEEVLENDELTDSQKIDELEDLLFQDDESSEEE